MILKIDNLLPTQHGYRISRESREAMVDFVSNGGVFDLKSITSHNHKKSSLIAITRFEDGSLYLRDGLHRTTAIYLARSERVLYPSEYQFEDMTYDMYLNAAPDKGWWTPFDPRIEVRLPDFLNFRNEAVALFKNRGEQAAIDFIAINKHRYAIPRTKIHNFESLSRFWIARSEAIV